MFELFDPTAELRIEHGANLPHWFQSGVSYFVTFRTADSIPNDVARLWHAKRADWLLMHGIVTSDPLWKNKFDELDRHERREFHQLFSQSYLDSLDKGYGECQLSRKEVATVVSDSLLHFDTVRYHLGDFVIMPNHVHLIVCLLGDSEIDSICQSWKRFSARQINLLLQRQGRFWQEESFDHLIRSEDQFRAIQRYIANNPRNLRAGSYMLRQT